MFSGFTLGAEVAPPVGAWIETTLRRFLLCWNPVAPPVGAWIETCSILGINAASGRRPSRRGVD